MMQSQRSAFSMITAIFLILMMSTVAIFIMNLSGKIIKETTTQYHKEQAVLLAKSYTELAIMTVMANDRNGTASCIMTINGTVVPPGGTITNADTNGEGYKVRTHIGFIGATADLGACSTGVRDFGSPVAGKELNIIVDVYVEYKDIGQLNPDASPYITYHRRTLQKI